jgi:hypothetical protein
VEPEAARQVAGGGGGAAGVLGLDLRGGYGLRPETLVAGPLSGNTVYAGLQPFT